MAAIVHRCACGHIEQFHTASTRHPETMPCTAAGCDCTDLDPGAPEVIPTWSSPTVFDQAVLDETVAEPGTGRSGLGQLCDCEDCRSLYRTETAARQVA